MTPSRTSRTARTPRRRRATAKPRAARSRATKPRTTLARSKPRGVEAPWELEQELRNDEHVRDVYDAMPPSHRKAYVTFIEEAKRPETRVRRVQQALRMMAQWSAERSARPPRKR